MKFLPALLICLFLLPAPVRSDTAGAGIKDKDRVCQSDGDCALITTSCNSCCPGLEPGETAAVNTAHAKTYESLGVCTPEHIKACGVPECGLAPTPYPAAVCRQGVCAVAMHPARSNAPP